MWITSNALARAEFSGKAVLVAGADGFIGMNAMRALRELNADVTIVSRDSSPRAARWANRVISGDLRDPGTARKAVAGQSLIFNMVGNTSAVVSNREPVVSLEDDCVPHLNLIQASIEQSPPPVFAFPSSRLVYGRPLSVPVDENHPTRPLSIYGAHKLTVENYLHVFGQTQHLPYCIFRISNPYGSYQKLGNVKYGIINYFMRLAAAGSPIKIFGDGEQLRDYIHVDDMVGAMLLATITPACHGEIFNIGGSSPISVRAAAETIAREAGGTPVQLEPWPNAYQSVETGDYITDLRKLTDALQLPSQASFEEGVRESLEYYRLETA